MKKGLILSAVILAISGVAQAAYVTIGEEGNAVDTTGYGAVGYAYRISVTEVTIAEFMASGAGDGDENYWNTGGRTVGTSAPAAAISLYEAMKYCNWLTSGNVFLGAYQFSGGIYQSTDRASATNTYGTVYALPTEDEWYKAAYFKNGAYSLYANGTATAPTALESRYDDSSPWTVGSGLLELNGTYDMMGNVYEWLESSSGVLRGGYYGSLAVGPLDSSSRLTVSPALEEAGGGFRIVAIPEPATALLFGLGCLGALLVRRSKKLTAE